MSGQEIQLRHLSADRRTELAPASLYDAAPPLSAEPETESVFAKVHRLLHNRYKWCALLSVVLAAAGVAAGIRLGQQTYVSTGIVQIKPYLPTIVTPIPETGMMPFYDQFVQSQIHFITSPRVVTKALESDGWKQLGRPLTDETMTEFLSQLTVRPIPRSEIVQVTFRDLDPRVASVAVESVLDAYREIHLENEWESEEGRKRRQLEDRKLRLTMEMNEVHKTILKDTDGFGIDGFRSLHQMDMQRLEALTRAKNELEVVIQTGEAIKGDPAQAASSAGASERAPVATAGTKTATATELSVAEIALRDPTMKGLLRELRAMEFELEFKQKLLGENHPRKVETRALMAAKQAEIENHAKDYRAANAGSVGALAGLSGASPAELKARLGTLSELVKEARDVVASSGKRLLAVEELQRKADQYAQDIEQARRRLDLLNTEVSTTGGRVRISEAGERATLYSDTRPKYAVYGGASGFAAGVGLFLLAGMIDRRFRSVHDARSSVGQLTLLGVLPSLPEDVGDPEQAALAAHCVHQIRTLLQISPGAAGSRVFSVTSPASGTGKTSLTLAMGVSFAAANSRTLIIDCDVIGGGLTARVDAVIRRRVGQVLRQQGLLTQQQLENALRVGATTSRKRFGDVLVDLGYVTRQDVDAALSMQQTTSLGLLDALAAGDRVEDCIADTGIERLSILPLGSASPMDVSKLSPSAIRRLIEHVRHQYDIVLIDTGPVPGSLEASVAAAACDGVVLVLSRGDQRPMAERCIQHLRDVGATIAGVVFNRAEARDMEVSTTAKRMSSVVRAPGASSSGLTPAERVQSPRYGPIASAVTGRASAPDAAAVAGPAAAARPVDRDE